MRKTWLSSPNSQALTDPCVWVISILGSVYHTAWMIGLESWYCQHQGVCWEHFTDSVALWVSPCPILASFLRISTMRNTEKQSESPRLVRITSLETGRNPTQSQYVVSGDGSSLFPLFFVLTPLSGHTLQHLQLVLSFQLAIPTGNEGVFNLRFPVMRPSLTPLLVWDVGGADWRAWVIDPALELRMQRQGWGGGWQPLTDKSTVLWSV